MIIKFVDMEGFVECIVMDNVLIVDSGLSEERQQEIIAKFQA
jgi:hypothetical protein